MAQRFDRVMYRNMPADGLSKYFTEDELAQSLMPAMTAPMAQAELPPELMAELAQESAPAPAPAQMPTAAQAAPAAMPAPTERNVETQLEEIDRPSLEKSLTGQMSGLKQLEDALKAYRAQKPQTDYTALAGFADYLAPGGTALKTAQALQPMSAEQKRLKEMDLLNAIQQRKEALTQGALAPLTLQQRLLAQMSKEKYGDTKTERLLFNQARKEQAGLVKEASDFRNSYRNVEDALKPDAAGTVSVARITQSLSQFARLMGEKGVLTDTDTGRQLAPTLELLMARYQSILTSNPNARLDEKNVMAMRDALMTAKRAFSEGYKTKADIYTEGYFNNPSSPYAGKEWGKKLVEDTYKPLELIKTEPEQKAPAKDPARQRLEDLRRKARGG